LYFVRLADLCFKVAERASTVTDHFYMAAAQIERTRPFFPLLHGVPRVDDRRATNGIIHVLKLWVAVAGCPGVLWSV